MGKYDGLSEEELMEAWASAKPGVNKPILKALAAKGTPAAAEFIHGCIRKQSTGKSARSVIEVLVTMGPLAAPWLAKMLVESESIQDARVAEWEEAMRALGDAGREAAQAELEPTVATYREAFSALDDELASLPDGLRRAARDNVLLGWAGRVTPEEEALLGAETELLARWAPHMLADSLTWDIAWQTKHQLLQDLALGVERLGVLAGEPFEPRVPLEDGSLTLAPI